MPAILSEGLENIQDLPQKEKERAVTALMRYLARVLQHKSSGEVIDILNDADNAEHVGLVQPVQRPTEGLPGIVIERNVREAMNTVSRPEFRTNPDALDDLAVPKGDVMKRRRTSHSL